MALLAESAVFALAGCIAWLWPVEHQQDAFQAPSVLSLGWGLAAAGPMLLFYLVSERIPWEPLQRVQQLLVNLLGPSLRACRWDQLALVAALAGIAEEVLFRGVLQPRMGLAASNVLFGLAHAVTPTYVVLAFGLGVYLGALASWVDLFAAIVAHGVYDFVAFCLVARAAGRTGVPGMDAKVDSYRPISRHDPLLQPAPAPLESEEGKSVGVQAPSGVASHGQEVSESGGSGAASGD